MTGRGLRFGQSIEENRLKWMGHLVKKPDTHYKDKKKSRSWKKEKNEHQWIHGIEQGERI